ncbi:phosphoribosylanthranilate isomerase [Sulfitobacter donghicola]|uniref:N-(5'-phosphoribosyl)anthranilate isomerase n=1 Tax=Sulfitobacter donghicola DSW-25 = KCTC 12864 = JCM 14565 TaxID=1300350 RepID=A0A073IEU2_9RHOB|nr:phosphoribosylanthranilate isomerase [Sulfitobacter donghicola]KEJ88035.1 N-(5'-phosphoribosyl)anthranilate isomerase [Sulfitobacter donghicola DSW-25 = KCTC 12864 = JCM 14565]KIN68753.1 N-(5'-phosphoribosyl)anthranilate isomerase [Sulfitobacter donghicola DSW-25 = KCTC 12864 = JCM 14565]
MPADTAVKICGLRKSSDIDAAALAGARYVGFVFFPKSPRHLEIPAAAALSVAAPIGLCKVALTVNADNAFLDTLVDAVPLDMLQLHGSESPERVSEVKARYGLPVMKAVGVAERSDLAQIDLYSGVADQILVDTKKPKGSDLPGGNGLTFDWGLLSRRVWRCPWMLAGGLTPENVGTAIKTTGARQIDLSSGVETSPGVKDPALIRAFIQAAQAA